MTSNYKVAGVWKQTVPKINVSSVWKTPTSAYINSNGSWKSWFLQGGINDDGFANYASNTLLNGTVFALSLQPDGKLVLGGNFTTFNGVTVNRIVRLNSDGTLDTEFTTNTGTGFSSGNYIYYIITQTDGKLVIGTDCTTFNGSSIGRLVRLNSDGTKDTTFATNIGTGANAVVGFISIQLDGKLIIHGNFTTFNGVTVNRIVRLNSDGTLDTAFTTNTGTGATGGATITTEASFVQPDGKIVVVGAFTTFNGVTVNRIVRLNSDGTRDTAFTTNTGTGFPLTPNCIVSQSDGKLVLAGSFTTFNGISRNRIVRIGGDVAI